MADEEPPSRFVDNVVKYTLAKSEMDDTKTYLQAGRSHKSLPEDELERLFIQAFKAYALAVSQGHSDPRALNDVMAEYRLRRIEPPFKKVQLEMSMLTDKVKEVVDQMTPEQKDEIGGDMIQEYFDDTDRKN